jgi:hypothetical protein
MPDDLTDEERAAVIWALRSTIDRDHYPRSPRLAPFRSALAKLDPSSVPKDPTAAQAAACGPYTVTRRAKGEAVKQEARGCRSA